MPVLFISSSFHVILLMKSVIPCHINLFEFMSLRDVLLQRILCFFHPIPCQLSHLRRTSPHEDMDVQITYRSSAPFAPARAFMDPLSLLVCIPWDEFAKSCHMVSSQWHDLRDAIAAPAVLLQLVVISYADIIQAITNPVALWAWAGWIWASFTQPWIVHRSSVGLRLTVVALLNTQASRTDFVLLKRRIWFIRIHGVMQWELKLRIAMFLLTGPLATKPSSFVLFWQRSSPARLCRAR